MTLKTLIVIGLSAACILSAVKGIQYSHQGVINFEYGEILISQAQAHDLETQ